MVRKTACLVLPDVILSMSSSAALIHVNGSAFSFWRSMQVSMAAVRSATEVTRQRRMAYPVRAVTPIFRERGSLPSRRADKTEEDHGNHQFRCRSAGGRTDRLLASG